MRREKGEKGKIKGARGIQMNRRGRCGERVFGGLLKRGLIPQPIRLNTPSETHIRMQTKTELENSVWRFKHLRSLIEFLLQNHVEAQC